MTTEIYELTSPHPSETPLNLKIRIELGQSSNTETRLELGQSPKEELVIKLKPGEKLDFDALAREIVDQHKKGGDRPGSRQTPPRQAGDPAAPHRGSRGLAGHQGTVEVRGNGE